MALPTPRQSSSLPPSAAPARSRTGGVIKLAVLAAVVAAAWWWFHAGASSPSAAVVPADLTGATIEFAGPKIALTDAKSGTVLDDEDDSNTSEVSYIVKGDTVSVWCRYTVRWSSRKFRSRYLVGKALSCMNADEEALLKSSPAIITVSGRDGNILRGVLNGFWTTEIGDGKPEAISNEPVTITLKP